MTIIGSKVILRDFIESDIEKRIYWETVETEWQNWDAPWEYANLTLEEKQEDLNRYIETMKSWVQNPLPAAHIRNNLQICLNNEAQTYIGWSNIYRIDENFKFSRNGSHCTIGINIPDQAARGQGCATEALTLVIQYLRDHGETDIYTQTWSGNYRMIGLANKLGFKECNRIPNARLVNGQYYDALTFTLKQN